MGLDKDHNSNRTLLRVHDAAGSSPALPTDSLRKKMRSATQHKNAQYAGVAEPVDATDFDVFLTKVSYRNVESA